MIYWTTDSPESPETESIITEFENTITKKIMDEVIKPGKCVVNID